jgi:hypothetical protein
MKYRKLRIAFTVACGILCLMQTILWARSYWRSDFFDCHFWTNAPVKTDWSTYYPSGCVLAISRLGAFNISIYSVKIRSRKAAQLVTFPNDEESASMMRDNYGFELGEVRLPRVHVAAKFAGLTIISPYWAPLILAASLAATPWLRWRFSLRTLLVAVTVVAVLLGAPIYAR